MYIINNIDRPLGIYTYGVLKKYSPTTITEGSIDNARYIDIRNDSSNNRVFIKGKDKRGNYIGNDGKTYSSTNPGRTVIYINKKKNQKNQKKPSVFPLYNQTTKKTTYYNNPYARDVAKKEILDLLKGGNKGGTPQRPQRPRLDPNRFVSIYDTTGLWKLHAQDNNLTDRDSVKRFLKEVLGFDDTLADGIWGGNTEAAYSRWKANKDAATSQLNSPTKLIAVSNTPISRWDINENLKGRFNNYASMYNYVNSNPEDTFSKAMTTRFGNTNTWNLQDVENALNVAGTYRGSDRKDIANSFNNYYLQQLKTDNNIKNIINNTNQTMNNWRNFTQGLKLFKNGGLVSRNPITRFKLNDSKRNFR